MLDIFGARLVGQRWVVCLAIGCVGRAFARHSSPSLSSFPVRIVGISLSIAVVDHFRTESNKIWLLSSLWSEMWNNCSKLGHKWHHFLWPLTGFTLITRSSRLIQLWFSRLRDSSRRCSFMNELDTYLPWGGLHACQWTFFFYYSIALSASHPKTYLWPQNKHMFCSIKV